MTCRVKICGTTSVDDALLAERYGADYVGVVLDVPYSERSVSVAEARSMVAALTTPAVILTYNRAPKWVADAVCETGASAAQLLGDESPDDVTELRRRLAEAGSEPVEVWKSLFLPPFGDSVPTPDVAGILARMRRFADAGAVKLLLDTTAVVDGRHRFGGTGKTSDWTVARELVQASPLPTFLSGGISPENVAEAVTRVRPYGIDLCSGVESTRGRRDEGRTAALFANLRALV